MTYESVYLACQLDGNRQQIEHERGYDSRLLAVEGASIDRHLSSEILEQLAFQILNGT